MKKVVIFALIAALAAGTMLYLYLDKLEQTKEIPLVYEDVLVAARDIPAFSEITVDMVVVKQVLQGSSHPRAARASDEAVGFVTEGLIVEGEEILPAKLKQQGQEESGLSYLVPQGMRALTVAVDEISGVAGFLQRGDYVDVIAYTTTSYSLEDAAQPEGAGGDAAQPEGAAENAAARATQSTSVVAAQNVRVAAVGRTLQRAAAGSGGASGEVYGSVTLFLTPTDVMRVLQAAKGGIITIVLRASGDHAPLVEEPVVNDTLLDRAE